MVGIRFGGGPDEILTSCIITPPYLKRSPFLLFFQSLYYIYFVFCIFHLLSIVLVLLMFFLLLSTSCIFTFLRDMMLTLP